ncbi:MAG TPA: hypothetical protein VIV11_08790 [Kofleriaceae bacterium]
MRSLWWLAFALIACGDVQKVPDAAIPDAFEPDAPPNALMCGTGEMACNGSCANVMTSDLYCGNCNTQCSPTQGCLNGTCVDKASRCTSIRLWDPAAPDGVYYNPNTGVNMYCDFTAGITYDDITMYRFDVTPATGYTIVRSTDFANASFAKAFIGLYNKQKGIRSFATYTSGNCCFSTTGGLDHHFAGAYIYPGIGTMVACGPPEGYIGGRFYTLAKFNQANADETLPDNYFTVNPPTEVALCSEAQNPAWWMKRRFTLN